ncbi:MAG: hypothetical protein M0P39_07075 [Rhodocyclaceae bacterium]|jgi:hypothetical protein|nr:hypothetical protein [Rhodocyclaceae bacterium]
MKSVGPAGADGWNAIAESLQPIFAHSEPHPLTPELREQENVERYVFPTVE